MERARWLLALDELHRDVPDRSWVTLSEWLGAFHDACDEVSLDAAKAKWSRLQRALREIGLEAPTETPSGEGLRLHMATPEIRELVSVELREAREVLERIAARDEGREPEDLDTDPPAAEVVENYAAKFATLRSLSRRYGRHRGTIARIIRASGRELRPSGRRPIEVLRPTELVARALRAWDEGASVRAVAKILRCARSSVRDLLRRHGRYPRSGP